MMTIALLNRILEIANIDTIINRAALVAYLIWFLILQHPRFRQVYGADSTIVWKDVFRYGICLAMANLIDKAGALVLTIGVDLWRVQHLIIGFWLMLFGSFGAALGTLLILRVLSKPRFGERVWLPVLVVNILYLLITFGYTV